MITNAVLLQVSGEAFALEVGIVLLEPTLVLLARGVVVLNRPLNKHAKYNHVLQF